MEENTPRKERERLFRRREIQNAAVKLFAEKGFSSTTLDEIAEASEYGKGTIYNYFENKEEIYFSLISDVFDNTTNILVETDSEFSEFIDFTKNYIKRIFKFCVENKNAYLIFVREMVRVDKQFTGMHQEVMIKFDETNKVILHRRFKVAIENGLVKTLDIDKVVAVFDNFIFPYVHFLLNCNSINDIDIEKETELISEVFLNGVCIQNSI